MTSPTTRIRQCVNLSIPAERTVELKKADIYRMYLATIVASSLLLTNIAQQREEASNFFPPELKVNSAIAVDATGVKSTTAKREGRKRGALGALGVHHTVLDHLQTSVLSLHS